MSKMDEALASIPKQYRDKLKTEALTPGEVFGAAWLWSLIESEFEALEQENKNYRRAIDNLTNGIPSQWAYAILRKERDQLRAELDKYLNAGKQEER